IPSGVPLKIEKIDSLKNCPYCEAKELHRHNDVYRCIMCGIWRNHMCFVVRYKFCGPKVKWWTRFFRTCSRTYDHFHCSCKRCKAVWIVRCDDECPVCHVMTE